MGLNRERRNVQQAKEDVYQEDEKSDGHRNETDLASLNLADHAQYAAYLVTHRHLKKTSRERTWVRQKLGTNRARRYLQGLMRRGHL